jgi:hypothetical protein
MRQGVLLAGVLGALLLVTIVFSLWVWDQLGDTEMGTQGYVALAIGAVATLAIGGALMGLVFYSSRHGYDDRAGGDPEGG